MSETSNSNGEYNRNLPRLQGMHDDTGQNLFADAPLSEAEQAEPVRYDVDEHETTEQSRWFSITVMGAISLVGWVSPLVIIVGGESMLWMLGFICLLFGGAAGIGASFNGYYALEAMRVGAMENKGYRATQFGFIAGLSSCLLVSGVVGGLIWNMFSY